MALQEALAAQARVRGSAEWAGIQEPERRPEKISLRTLFARDPQTIITLPLFQMKRATTGELVLQGRTTEIGETLIDVILRDKGTDTQIGVYDPYGLTAQPDLPLDIVDSTLLGKTYVRVPTISGTLRLKEFTQDPPAGSGITKRLQAIEFSAVAPMSIQTTADITDMIPSELVNTDITPLPTRRARAPLLETREVSRDELQKPVIALPINTHTDIITAAPPLAFDATKTAIAAVNTTNAADITSMRKSLRTHPEGTIFSLENAFAWLDITIAGTEGLAATVVRDGNKQYLISSSTQESPYELLVYRDDSVHQVQTSPIDTATRTISTLIPGDRIIVMPRGSFDKQGTTIQAQLNATRDTIREQAMALNELVLPDQLVMVSSV